MKQILFLLIVLLLLISSCKKNELLPEEDQISAVTISLNGVNDPGSGYWYRAWLVMGSEYQNIGVFSDKDSDPVVLSNAHVNLGYLQKAQGIIITISDTNATVPDFSAPRGPRILGAELTANQSQLSVGNEYLLDSKFQFSEGYYSIETPTDSTQQDGHSGIWFVKHDSTMVNPGLTLPELTGGWKYEGWVVAEGETLSTGAFTSPIGMDESGQYSDSTASALSYPGEDFLLNSPAGVSFPLDLSGKEVFITLSPPYPSAGNEPYKLKLFTANVPAQVTAKHSYQMENNIVNTNLGQVQIDINLYDD